MPRASRSRPHAAAYAVALHDMVTTMKSLVADWPLPLLPKLVAGLHALLEATPVIERGYGEISKRNHWLAQASARAVVRLIESRDQSVLAVPALSILRKLPIALAAVRTARCIAPSTDDAALELAPWRARSPCVNYCVRSDTWRPILPLTRI
jgi:hypothetical protein